SGGRRTWDALKLRLPVLGSTILKMEMARFARTLGTLIASAVPLIAGVRINGTALAIKVPRVRANRAISIFKMVLPSTGNLSFNASHVRLPPEVPIQYRIAAIIAASEPSATHQ